MAENATPAAEMPDSFRAAPREAVPTLSLAALAHVKSRPFVILPGDVLKVMVYGADGPLGQSGVAVRVNHSGMIVVPQVGGLPVGELTLAQAEATIGKAFQDAKILRRPQVFIEASEAEGNWIAVTGEVGTAGLYQLPRQASSVLAALAKAGGLSKTASPVVEIARSARGDVARLDLLDPDSIRRAGKELWLENGDLVRVLPWPQRVVYVTGLVTAAGPVRLPTDRNLDLLSAIGMAGGVDAVVSPTQVVVVRTWNRDGTREMAKITLDLRDAAQDPRQNLILQDGDFVAVVHDSASFQRAVWANAIYVRMGASANVVPGF